MLSDHAVQTRQLMSSLEGLPPFQACGICKYGYAEADLESISQFRAPVGLASPWD